MRLPGAPSSKHVFRLEPRFDEYQFPSFSRDRWRRPHRSPVAREPRIFDRLLLYQREYKWQRKQVAELLEDLVAKFLDSYEAGHERNAVADYGHYFLGSIVISDKDGQKLIIDG